MYKGRFCSAGGLKVANGYVETDPSGRYGRVSAFDSCSLYYILVCKWEINIIKNWS